MAADIFSIATGLLAFHLLLFLKICLVQHKFKKIMSLQKACHLTIMPD